MIQSYSCMFIDHSCQTFEDKEKTSFTHSTHTSCLNFSKICLSNVSSQRVITETNSTWKGNLSQSYEWIYPLEQNTSINSIDLGAPVVNLLYFKSRKITTDLETRVLLLLQKLAASDNIQNSKGEGVFTYGYRSSRSGKFHHQQTRCHSAHVLRTRNAWYWQYLGLFCGGETPWWRSDQLPYRLYFQKASKQPGPLKKFLFWPLAADSLLFEFKKISVRQC